MEVENNGPAKHVKLTSDSVGFNIKVNRKTAAPVSRKDKEEPAKETEPEPDLTGPVLDDPVIDKAVDDIAVSDSSELLAVEDTYRASSLVPKKTKLDKLKKLLKNKWFYISICAVVVILFSVPLTRYFILGQFMSSSYKFTVIDNVTDKPVSGAVVTIGENKAGTNAYGQAVVKAGLGKRKFEITKQYYAQSSGQIFVGFKKSTGDIVYLSATGRQVEIKILNKLTNQPISGVKISVLNTNATTNSSGKAQIVLPTKKSFYEAKISVSGFNSISLPINVNTGENANLIKLVPTGYIYFLSNATGTINVVRANLDGSNPTTILAGTGNETASTTLMASPDNNYLVLEARRNGSQPELYIIDANNESLTEFDSSTSNFNLIGWSGDMFIYDATNTSEPTTTVGLEQLKSYNAQSGQLNVLDEDQVEGSSSSYANQSFANYELLPNQVVYTTSWTSTNSYDLTSSTDSLRSVDPNGLGKKDYQTFPAATTTTMSIARYQPNSLYLSVSDSSTNQISYYTFTDSNLTSSTITSATFTSTNPTYYLSPSESEYLWTANENGSNETYTANSSDQNQKRISLPATYTAYGWYNSQYILLTKDGSMYIAPVTGTNSPQFVANLL
jgi:hypothetical protein